MGYGSGPYPLLPLFVALAVGRARPQLRYGGVSSLAPNALASANLTVIQKHPDVELLSRACDTRSI